MSVHRIDVLINVVDVDRSLSFYHDLIGMRLDSSWTDAEGRTRWAKLIAPGGNALMLNQPTGDLPTDRASRPAYRDAVIYLHVESADELSSIHHRLSEAGLSPGQCHDEAYGQREFIVRDPDGYEIALATRLGPS